MSRRALRTNAVVGLVLALTSSLFLLLAIRTFGDLRFSFIGVGTSIASAVIAAIVLLGPAPTRRWFRISIPMLTGLSTIGAWYVIAGLIGPQTEMLICSLDPAHPGVCEPPPFDPTTLIVPIATFVLYLIAATLYGFAGQKQGVKVGARTGLLVLLLLSIIPFANILGLIGFLITAVKRTTPEPPAASG
jgi:hypothetical protein